MPQFLVEELNIKNISQEKNMMGGYFLYFRINDICYRMKIKKKFDNFRPISVAHADFRHEDETCPICGKTAQTFKVCSNLQEHSEELFYRLINSNKLRLQWLFIPHDETNGGDK